VRRDSHRRHRPSPHRPHSPPAGSRKHRLLTPWARPGPAWGRPRGSPDGDSSARPRTQPSRWVGPCRTQVGKIACLHARAAHVVLRGCLGDVAWSAWPSDGRNPSAPLGARAAATQRVRHMIIEQLAPDADHRRELSCEPPVAERAGGRLDHHAPPHAPGPRRERHPWARGHSPVGASLPSAEHTPCRCTCICKCRSDKQLP
jgi:hypothetical protein